MYTQQEIGDYLSTIRIKCKKLIDSLTEEKLSERFTEGTEPEDMDYPILEITLYNLRHTQHHVAQLNLLIRQDLNQHMEWAFRAEEIKITF
ncbi:MAG: DinB family protein [Lewinellaceae bacterium]|nr:DinB family protein [Lewinellaceae bacterium]